MFSYIPSVYLINILPLDIIEKCILNCNRRFHEISPVSQSISRLFDGIFDTPDSILYNSLYRKKLSFSGGIDMKPLPFIMQYVRRYKYRYIAGILTLFAVDAASVFIPKLTGIITDGLTARSITWSSIRTCLLGIFLIGLLLAVGRFLWRYFLFGTARIIERELRNEMFSHLETMDVEYYNSHKTGDLMTRFTSDLNAVRMALGPAVICIFDSVVMTLLVVCQMMYYVNIKLTLLALIPMVIICLGYMHYGKVLDNLYTERQDSVSNLADFVQESFSGIRVIKAFVRKQAEILSFSKKNQDTMDKSMRIAKLEAILIPLLDVIIGFPVLPHSFMGDTSP